MSSMCKPSVRINMSSAARDTVKHPKGCGLTQVREKCRNLQMDQCYNRYRERLVLTNLALYLFIMELLLAIHVTFLIFKTNAVLLDMLLYTLAIILLPLILYVCFQDKNKFVHFRLWNNLASAAAIILVAFVDTLQKFLASTGNQRVFVCYDHITIASIYLVLPIDYYGRPYVLGCLISIWYYCFKVFMVKSAKRNSITIFACYGLYLLSLNVLMIAFRYNIEYRLRQKILQRRQLLYQSLLLKMAMKKESEMVNAIIPPKILDSFQQEIYTRIEDERLGKNYLTPRTLFVEIHSDVSILVADMVNFTYLTTQLECKQLVTILHDLFVAFDVAAERNNVLRIKFSGDCYLCVAGIEDSNVQHAKFCVNLALEMISETHHLRQQWDLNIDMRIGVHSGEVLSAFIGSTKWQYDIWSKDTDIAHRLESTGKPGNVHISKATLSLLDNEYVGMYEEVTKLTKKDPLLQKLRIKTYLITPIGSSPLTKASVSYTTSISNVANLSHIHIDEFEEIWSNTRLGMIEMAGRMPVGCIQLARIFYFAKRDIPGNEDSLFRPHITSILRLFRSADYEWLYMNEPDVLMKYSMLMVLYVGVIILLCDQISEYPSKGPTMFISLAVLFIITLAVCFKHICVQLPWCKTEFLLFALSEIFEKKLLARILVCFCSIFILYFMATLNPVECSPLQFRYGLNEADASKQTVPRMCFDPWELTELIILILAVFFIFGGLPLIFKGGLTACITISYILIVKAFHFTWSKLSYLPICLGYPGIWYVLQFCILLLLSEHHFAYINKADFHTKICYEEQLKRTQESTKCLEIMLANILPRHVTDIFIKSGHSDELFYEEYSKIAVMFAAIKNYQADTMSLRVLNDFICCFDDLLANYVGQCKVEKIKVVDWTYMTACGLDAERIQDHNEELPSKKHNKKNRTKKSCLHFLTKTVTEQASSSSFKPRFIHPNLQKDDNCVLTMLQFAADMLRIMEEIRRRNVYLNLGDSVQGNLKIGISHGPVMAGVIGYSRPQYDIWGHTVNMASHMTSTGIVDKIQVTEDTAMVLRNFDVKCNYRGLTEVKEVGAVPTYLVAVDNAFNFEHIDDIDLDKLKFVGMETYNEKSLDAMILNMKYSKNDLIEASSDIDAQDEIQTKIEEHPKKYKTEDTEDSSTEEFDLDKLKFASSIVILDIIDSENDSSEDLNENDAQAKSTEDLNDKETQTVIKRHFKKNKTEKTKDSNTKETHSDNSDENEKDL